MKHSIRNVRGAGLWAIIVLLVCLIITPHGRAQQKQDFAGDYAGTLGPLHIALHLAVAANGTVSATVDSPDQKLLGLPCSDVQINGPALTFSVPAVHGDWTGVMSSDHNSLSGVWKQNGTVAVMFTRAGSRAADAAPLAGTAGPAPVQASPGAASRPPCSPAVGAVAYWDGNAWKPMVMAAHLGRDTGVSIKDGLKNPFNRRAGFTSIVTFKNPAATLTLGGTPSFCVFVSPNTDPTVVMIGEIDVKKDHRELETCAGPCASRGRSADDWMPAKRSQPVDIKRLSDNTVEITLKMPLKPGQYIIGGPPLIGYFDFGVGDSGPQ